MPVETSVLDVFADALFGRGFDPHLVGNSFIDLGPQADRARAIARKLNAVRGRSPKEPVLLWTTGCSAVTKRGRWVYLSCGFVQQLSDDALAFVLAHEMAHHDLHHLTTMYVAAGALGNWQRIELAADREGLRLVQLAGFDPRGALEALDPERWPEEEPPDPFAAWPAELRTFLDRFRRSHPPLGERRQALLALLGRAGATPSSTATSTANTG